jgi:hypothetical protein
MRTFTSTLITTFTALAATTACSSGLTDFEGIYTIESWQENPAGCDSPGDSVLESNLERAFYVKTETFFVKFVNVVLCTDVAECAEMAGEDDTIFFGVVFDDGSDSSGWQSHSFFGGNDPNQPDACAGTLQRHRLSSPTDGTVEIRTEEVEVSGVPRDSDGFCDLDAAAAAAEGQPCVGLEVVSGSFAQDI